MLDPDLRAVLDFWRGEPGSADYGTFRDIWFRASTPEFDRQIRDAFLDIHERAVAGEFKDAMNSAEGTFALLILLDQFPRNMFRGTARAFATDPQARAVAKHAVERGFDRQVDDVYRVFFYLPYEHSESLSDQERGLELMRATGNERTIEAALDHIEVIKRFGRFPHRNAAMGRESTSEELDYLKDGKSWGQ